MYASSRLPSAADISAIACSRVSDFDGRPPSCPFGGSTSAATLRPTRSSRSACRIARASTLCAICSVRVDSRDAIYVSAFWTSAAVRSVSRTAPSSSIRAFTIVPRYKVTVRAESPSVPRASQSSSASPTV
jgi:hypothetical protein